MKNFLICALVASSLSMTANASWYITPYGSSSSKTDVKGSSDNVKYNAYGIEAGNEDFKLGFKTSSYDFDRATDLNDLKLFYGDIHHTGDINEDLKYFIGSSLSFGFKDGIEANKSFNLVPRAGLIFVLDYDWSLLLGGGIAINKADYNPFALAQLIFKDENTVGLSGKIGFPSTEINYRFNEIVSVGAGVSGLDGGHYYLKDIDGYMQESGYVFDAAVTLNPFEHLDLKLGAAYNYDKYIQFYDNNRNKLGKVKFENDASVYFQGSAKF